MVYLSHCFPQHNHIPTAYWSFMLHCHKCWMLIMRIKVDLIIHDNNIPIPTMQFWALIPSNILSENHDVHVYVYCWRSRHENTNILHRGILFDRFRFGYHGVFHIHCYDSELSSDTSWWDNSSYYFTTIYLGTVLPFYDTSGEEAKWNVLWILITYRLTWCIPKYHHHIYSDSVMIHWFRIIHWWAVTFTPYDTL